MDTLRNDNMDNTRANTVPAEAVAGYPDSEGAMGEVAGTGAGAISGGVIGAVVGGPIGAIVGAVAGGMLGKAGGEAAHKIGDDHDDVNLATGSEGEVGRDAGAGAGAISGAVIGTAAGPVGTVVGAVAGGMLGAAAGDATKHMGENDAVLTNGVPVTTTPVTTGRVVTAPVATTPVSGMREMPATVAGVPVVTADTAVADLPGNRVPGIQTGGRAIDGTPDTRGLTEKAADALTGDYMDDKTGKVVA